MNSYLELQSVRKRFGNAAVLNGVHLDVAEGELVTLLGPSGCGKSTLLRCIAGLAVLDGGRIVLQGRDLGGLAPRERQVGMVFQSFALFPNLTAGENVEYGLRMRGESKRGRRRRAEELLALVDLEDKRDVYPHHLSGGQQQRIALARSLAVQPKLLLLDEPLSALDAQIRKNLRSEIRSIQQRLNMTTLFVTHDQEEALTMSDRVCIMNKGVIVQEGTPEQIYMTPRTEFAARFMGSYNVMTRPEALRLFGSLEGSSDSYALRPESVKLIGMEEDPSGHAGRGKRIVDGTVDSVSVLGTIVRYSIEAAGVKLTIDALNDGRLIGIGERRNVRLALDCSQLLQLEKEGA
ncbi:ABC transporter ATP-binding protein [Cohnella thailandensis]|uniref:Carnitine transport ATP-binding protein OpuCA n=1 Tax=Cohnella thailandensis TaxID=557557 RepID=A0A841SWX5_9BACL|nr:ABC transporter ATP-binding protein [Cohnella thailandensis]MBB6634678.1 ABC transporter ATP-binding protein [Cohnella thailandensis]MBP1972766.1 putative spermidine/putrescine transport system ATP-binding protein [Cohnella thailandensis]